MSKLEKIKETKYSTKKVLESKELEKYQRDFAKAVLTDSEYTLDEAVEKIENKLKEEA